MKDVKRSSGAAESTLVYESDYSRRVPLDSRLIPGLRTVHRHPGRKPPRSVTWDARYWESEVSGQASQQGETFAEAVLPLPVLPRKGLNLASGVAADFLLVAATFSLISLVGLRFMWLGSAGNGSTAGVAMLYCAVLTLLGHSEGLYQGVAFSDQRRESVILGKTVAWTTLLVILALSFTGASITSERLLAAAAPVVYFATLGWRMWQRRLATRRALLGENVRNVLIVGATREGRRLADRLKSATSFKCRVVGFLEDSGPLGGDVVGRVADLSRVARAQFVDEVVLAIPQQRDLARQVIREARRHHLDVKVVPDLLGFDLEQETLESIGSVPVFTLHRESIPAAALLLKRTLDIGAAGLCLILLSPLLACLALVIRLDSAGPVLYRAWRVGKKGRRFLCCKFRTMVQDAESLKDALRHANEREGPFFKIANDPRITRVGRILRRFSLDELPQLWNVFKGDMSMVGPRPHPIDDFKGYRREDFRRLDVMPGLTGLWQVTARDDPSFQRNMGLDLEYIERWSLKLDLQILWRTVAVVLSGSGT